MSRTVAGFLFSFFAGELWVEATAFAIPQFALALSGGFLSMALVAGLSAAALGAGNLLGGPVVDRLGVRKAYVGMMALRTAAAAALAVNHLGGGVGLTPLALLFGLEYFFIGVSRVAEGVLPAALFGSDLGRINRFGSWQLRLLAAVGILGPPAVTGFLSGFGFGPMLLAFAAVLGLGTLAAFLSVRVAAPGADFDFRRLGEALSALRERPILKRAAVGAGIPLALVFFLYLLVAHAFGLFVTGSAAAAPGVMAWLVGLYSAGGFAGSWYSSWASTRAERRLALLTELPRAYQVAASRRVFLWSTRRKMTLAGLALLGLWALALAPAAGPLPAYLAMAALGFTGTAAMVQSETLIRDEAPEAVRGTVIGLIRAATMLGIGLGFAPLGAIFHYLSVGAGAAAVPSLGAFLAVGLASTLGAASFLAAARGLKSPAGPAAPPAAEAPFTPAPTPLPEGVSTLRELARHRPLAEILAEIRGISHGVGWARWMDAIDALLAGNADMVLLHTDASGRVQGFLLLDDRYTTDFGDRVVLPGPGYVAYMAARPAAKGKGVGTKLLLAAGRIAARSGPELRLHVHEGEPAIRFYEAMAKRMPILRRSQDRSYVAGERWLLISFDVSGLR